MHLLKDGGGLIGAVTDSEAMSEITTPQGDERAPPSALAAPVAIALPACVRVADGRVYDGPLEPVRHRSLQIGLLHSHSAGYVEIAAGPRQDGKVRINTRTDAAHFQPGGRRGPRDWLEHLLALAASHADRGDEVFVGVAPRNERRAGKAVVTHSHFVWIDVDQAGELPRLWRFMRERPAQLVVESGGSGGAHAYWRLKQPLVAQTVNSATGEVVDWIERAHRRLIGRLAGDPSCKDRSRVLRVAGTRNYKSGRYARVMWADFAHPGYDIEALVGDLPDPAGAAVGRRVGRTGDHDDPYKRIAPPDYFWRLVGIEVPASGLVSCPCPDHPDRHPSCKVGTHADEGWFCRSCGRGGAIYDLASAMTGGPVGTALRGEDFKRACALVREAFGER